MPARLLNESLIHLVEVSQFSDLLLFHLMSRLVQYDFFDRNLTLQCITAQKMKFTIKDFFSKCDQIRWWKTSFFVQCMSLETGSNSSGNFSH